MHPHYPFVFEGGLSTCGRKEDDNLSLVVGLLFQIDMLLDLRDQNIFNILLQYNCNNHKNVE